MDKTSFLIPKCPEEIETCLAHPWALYELVKHLEEKGVKSEPPLRELSPEDARNAIRCIFRELRFREAQ